MNQLYILPSVILMVLIKYSEQFYFFKYNFYYIMKEKWFNKTLNSYILKDRI